MTGYWPEEITHLFFYFRNHENQRKEGLIVSDHPFPNVAHIASV